MTNPIDHLPLSAANALLRDVVSDRILGCIVGSALGDAMGLYTEFLSAKKVEEVYGLDAKFTLQGRDNRFGPTQFYLDLHRAAKDPGHWTDDTDHALLLLLGWLHTASTSTTGDGDAQLLPTQTDLAARLVTWVQQGLLPLETMPLGLGKLVSSVVSTKDFVKEPARVSKEYWVKTGRHVAPNGSLMRTHPLGVIGLWMTETEMFGLAAEISRTTHADPRCVVACVIGTGLVRGLLRGEVSSEKDVDELLERAIAWFLERQKEDPGRKDEPELDVEELKKHVHVPPLVMEDGDRIYGSLKLDDPPAIGYVYKTLGAGVFTLRWILRSMAPHADGNGNAKDEVFEKCITHLIMQGGDADTNACFAGALLGAYLGYVRLPGHWKHGLTHGRWLFGKAEAMCKVLGVMEGEYVGKEDKSTWLDGGKGMISQQDMEVRWMVLQQKAAKRIEEGKAKEEARRPRRPMWMRVLGLEDRKTRPPRSNS
ncbi:ADP-ribosylglycohydrolase-domain-containing protein [Apodospora peruviana]|uniref:ADP-ribosylglycohydrolase-domain-containing protein n=1 Tax=Apodospora peruviana TaxID=516989 RepID=A0AAE0M165_9PEZI|nr:ADP-ribosylglycohydrolase-domain-containing protein [Apodospora peruviana]